MECGARSNARLTHPDSATIKADDPTTFLEQVENRMHLLNANGRLFALVVNLFALAVAQADAPLKPETPSACKLDLRIVKRGDREIGVLIAEYQFRTAVADARVALGLEQGKLTAATLDGRLPAFASTGGRDGFVLAVDRAGEHTARLELEVAVILRGTPRGDRGIQLTLPGCPITTLNKVEFPAGAARIRLGGKPVAVDSVTGSTALWATYPAGCGLD